MMIILLMMVVRRNLDPTRHTNSDALKAHIITFEVTNTSLIAHFFGSLAHITISDCCWKWNISLQTLLEEEEDQLKGFFIFRKTFKTTLTLTTRTGFTYIFDCSGLSLSHLSIWSPAEVSFEFRNFGNLLTWTCKLWSPWWNEVH